MPDRPETDSAEAAARAKSVAALIQASESGRAAAPPNLSDAQAARAVREQVLARRLAAGERRIGYRFADGSYGIITDTMRFATEMVVRGDRLIAPHARPALAFRLARAVTGEMSPADLPPTLGAVALAIDIGDSRIEGAASEADRLADNGGAGCFVLGEWRAITGRFADRELILEARRADGAPQSASALFVDPAGDAVRALERCRAEHEVLAEGALLLIVASTASLALAAGASLTLAAGEVGTLSVEIGG